MSSGPHVDSNRKAMKGTPWRNTARSLLDTGNGVPMKDKFPLSRDIVKQICRRWARPALRRTISKADRGSGLRRATAGMTLGVGLLLARPCRNFNRAAPAPSINTACHSEGRMAARNPLDTDQMERSDPKRFVCHSAGGGHSPPCTCCYLEVSAVGNTMAP